MYPVGREGERLVLKRVERVEQEICGLACWSDNGPPGNMWLGFFFKVGLGPDRWIIRKFRLLGN